MFIVRNAPNQQVVVWDLETGEVVFSSEELHLCVAFSPDGRTIITDRTRDGLSTPIQVKTVRGGGWQFSLTKFADISFDGPKQIIGNKKSLPIPQLLCVFVRAGEKYGEDQFFVLEWSRVQDIVIANHKRWLDAHGGVRPSKPDSLHCAIVERDLHDYKDNWALITNKP